MGASGTVSIAPDTLGYSNTYDYFRGYVVKKQYQTSFIPLWLKTKRTIAEETKCASELGNGLTIAGYSEGGYGAFAIAEAAQSVGIDVQAVLSGAGPYLTSSALLTTGYTSMAEGTFPLNRRHYTIQLGQSYSSTYSGVENYGTGQDLLADSWFVGSTQFTKYDAVNAVTDSGGSDSLNKLVPSPISIDSLGELFRTMSHTIDFFIVKISFSESHSLKSHSCRRMGTSCSPVYQRCNKKRAFEAL